jgi:hypothetical protein
MPSVSSEKSLTISWNTYRHVDIFQGRAPKSVIAKHYTGKELDRLKRIYEKADLRALNG